MQMEKGTVEESLDVMVFEAMTDEEQNEFLAVCEERWEATREALLLETDDLPF